MSLYQCLHILKEGRQKYVFQPMKCYSQLKGMMEYRLPSNFRIRLYAHKYDHIKRILSTELKASSKEVNGILYSHPKREYFEEKEVLRTVTFLKSVGFGTEAIRESLAICFYPKENIEHALTLIQENSSLLKQYGITDGFTKTETHIYLKGTKLRDKRLQLCLYYLEQPFSFNGSGIFNIKDL